MLRFTPEAGGRIADRYLLEECIEKHNGTSTWQAMDETLVRPVTIHIMATDHELAEAVLTAAQAASSIDDGRFLRVLDAARREDMVYVVHETLSGARRLSDALADEGPLDPLDAQMLIMQTAEAMAVAHAAGLVHLRLQPDTLLLIDGQVKIAGLCTDAALHQTSVPDPTAGDARALGRLFYAALTGKWPDGEAFGLPAAPFEHGSICTPRQVRAGVPDAMNALVDRMVNFNPRSGQALRSPAEITYALRQLPRPRPPASVGPDTTGPMSAVSGILAPLPTAHGWKPSAATRGIQFAVVTMLGLGLVLLVFQILRTLNPAASENDPVVGSGPMQGIRVTSVRDFDPPPGDGGENGNQARFAVDGKPTTSWTTLVYPTAGLGNTKPGVGLVLDLGRPTTVRQVALRFRGEGGSVEIRAASPSETKAPPDTASYFVAASRENTSPGETLRFAFATKTRFLLVWLVQLPKDPSGNGYRGGISEIRVSG